MYRDIILSAGMPGGGYFFAPETLYGTDGLQEAGKAATMKIYDEGDNLKVMQTAAQVEHEGYMKWCRKSSGLQRGWVIKNLALQAVWG